MITAHGLKKKYDAEIMKMEKKDDLPHLLTLLLQKLKDDPYFQGYIHLQENLTKKLAEKCHHIYSVELDSYQMFFTVTGLIKTIKMWIKDKREESPEYVANLLSKYVDKFLG